MQTSHWNIIRSHIVTEALYEMRKFLTETKRNNLYNVLKDHFKVEPELLTEIKTDTFYYLDYDRSLFNAICTYLHDNSKFNYDIKPTLTEYQLNAIKNALDTLISVIIRCKGTMPKFIERMRSDVAIKLSNDYNIATEDFVKWYENIFADLANRLKEEVNLRDYVDNNIIQNISSQIYELDHELFSKLILFIRAQLSDNLNYPLEK